jgi:hypothetical protein
MIDQLSEKSTSESNKLSEEIAANQRLSGQISAL